MKDTQKEKGLGKDLAQKPIPLKEKAYYPSLTFDAKDVPGLEKYAIGAKVMLTIVGKIVRVSQEADGPRQVTVECRRANAKRKQEG